MFKFTHPSPILETGRARGEDDGGAVRSIKQPVSPPHFTHVRFIQKQTCSLWNANETDGMRCVVDRWNTHALRFACLCVEARTRGSNSPSHSANIDLLCSTGMTNGKCSDVCAHHTSCQQVYHVSPYCDSITLCRYFAPGLSTALANI